ncbi:acyl-CoA dehydrogenase family protein [Actinospica robiniae]|uniref:acyl-CoA dehydrogenase family protein n=1 Tax=Actinospica robiniae TaxID=304901 RepID=UPI00040465CE|nr:acyl-CoA dehydrogenase family protein [Actinospica robiniae]
MAADIDLTALRAEARELARGLRSVALEIDAAPLAAADLRHPALEAVQTYDPVRLGNLGQAVALLELAAGDAGAVLACPGPALAGVLVRILGDEAQNERLRAAVADGRTWGYLAVTEPDAGSDVTRLSTELRPDGDGGHLLYGRKRYIGNGYRGDVGVVLARTGPGPVALRAALLTSRPAQLTAAPLDTVGLRGAQISELTFDGVPIAAEDLLGNHLTPLRRGMWGVQQAFNTVRVQVAAMAVGTAAAVHAYVRAERVSWNASDLAQLDAARAETEAARNLVLQAAAELDADRRQEYLPALAKLTAVRTARDHCRRLPRLLGRGAFLEHPLLEKWWRDSAAFEFMEGTSHIQRLHTAQGYLKARPAVRTAHANGAARPTPTEAVTR